MIQKKVQESLQWMYIFPILTQHSILISVLCRNSQVVDLFSASCQLKQVMGFPDERLLTAWMERTRRSLLADRKKDLVAEKELLVSAACEQLNSMESSRLVYLYSLDPPGDPWCRTMN